jgi:hypothetical protein
MRVILSISIFLILGFSVLFLATGSSIFAYAVAFFCILVILLGLHIYRNSYKLVDYDNQSLLLKRRKERRVIKWTEVDSFYCSSVKGKYPGPICLVLNNGEIYNIVSIRGDVPVILDKLYDLFLYNLRDHNNIKKIEFPHPLSWIKYKNLDSIEAFIGTVVIVFLIVSLLIAVYIKAKNKNIVIWPFSVPMILIIVMLISLFLREYFLKQKRKGIVSLKIDQSGFTFQLEHGSRQIKTLSEIVRYKLDKTNGSITFSDGTKLMDIEKLRYWPILREYLLSKLEQPERQNLPND